MTSTGATSPSLTLVTVGGPKTGEFVIPATHPALVGRAADADVCLLHEGVSRRHAQLIPRAGSWFVADQGSARGTFLNGVRLEKLTPNALAPGDVLGIGPWTFRVAGERAAPSTVVTVDDGAAQRVERITDDTAPWAVRRLRLLTGCIARMQQTRDQTELARAALDSALMGSGYSRGAILRPLSEGSEAAVLVSQRADPKDTTEFRFSRSLILSAATGEPVVLWRESLRVQSHSIAEMGIHSAMCVPVKLGETVAEYLYMDARGSESQILPDAVGFCEAVASAYGMALASLKRAELERRQREMAEDLRSAHEAQRHMLPPLENDLGFLRYAMEMRPGVFVAGDLFDVAPLGDDACAIFIGDVAGHGVGAAMLMAMVQSHLNAVLARTRDPALAVSDVNRFMASRAFGGTFVSLWLGVFERSGRVLFVDAGHGYCAVRPAGALAHPRAAASATGIPMGIDPHYEYRAEKINLTHGDRLVLFTDGMAEQRAQSGEEFGLPRLGEAIAAGTSPADDVRRMFSALTAFAGVRVLDDDATAASIEFRGQ